MGGNGINSGARRSPPFILCAVLPVCRTLCAINEERGLVVCKRNTSDTMADKQIASLQAKLQSSSLAFQKMEGGE